MIFPIEGCNKFTVDNINSFRFNLLNPYHPMSYAIITIEWPVFPNLDPDLPPIPEVTIDDVLFWCESIKPLVEDGTQLRLLLQALLEVSKEVVNYYLVGNDILWKRLVALYTGHHFQGHIELLKDEANQMSMNPEKTNQKNESEIKTKASKVDSGDEFESTNYGKMFWRMYSRYAKIELFGLY